MVVIPGSGVGLPVPRAPAEWMGLLADICWALAMVYVKRTEHVSDFDKVFVQFLFLGGRFFPLTLLLEVIVGLMSAQGLHQTAPSWRPSRARGAGSTASRAAWLSPSAA